MKIINYIDLFCGAGGLSLGFKQAGLKNVFSNDSDKVFAETYSKNFPKHNLVIKKIEDISNIEIKNLVKNKQIDILAGGPPCQGFSIAGNIGRKFQDDPRNYLFREFMRFVKILNPKIVLIENVERLHKNEKIKIEIIDTLNDFGYRVESKILNTSQYSIPQVRRRVFFIASRVNEHIIFPKKNMNSLTIKDAIDDLPKIQSGESSDIPNHIAMNHTEQMLEKMSFISDGGSREQIPSQIRPKSGDIRKYIKFDSNKPSICITGDMRKVFHYSQNRALTVRELARIQTFPDSFIFFGPSISQQQQVGNAVPPLLAKKIAKCLVEMINESK